MSDIPKDCGYTKYSGRYVGGADHAERKPVMAEARRKVLNLLEFILEVDNTIDTVYNVFMLVGGFAPMDLSEVSDEEWAEWLQEYADSMCIKRKDTT